MHSTHIIRTPAAVQQRVSNMNWSSSVPPPPSLQSGKSGRLHSIWLWSWQHTHTHTHSHWSQQTAVDALARRACKIDRLFHLARLQVWALSASHPVGQPGGNVCHLSGWRNDSHSSNSKSLAALLDVPSLADMDLCREAGGACYKSVNNTQECVHAQTSAKKPPPTSLMLTHTHTHTNQHIRDDNKCSDNQTVTGVVFF